MDEQRSNQRQTTPTKDAAPPTTTPARAKLEGDPATALEVAKTAIDRLDQSTSTSRDASRWAIGAVVVVFVLAIVGIVVHTFYEKDAPRVDGTTALLLAVLLFAPFIRHLRALEFGGAKAEFQDSTSTGLTAVLAAVKADHDAIYQVFVMITELTAQPEPGEPEGTPSTPDTTTAALPASRRKVAPRPLRRILWVDDNPEGNRYEFNALSQLFEITIARNTVDAVDRLDTASIDGVISDIVRSEDGEIRYDAGARIAEHAARLNPPLPVFYYGSKDAVDRQAQTLTELGAVVVTADYVELVRAIRRQARASFDAAVRQALDQASDQWHISEQVEDIDFLLDLTDGRKVAVETPHWLKTPSLAAVQARYDKLSKAITSGKAASALLVTQKGVLTPSQRREAPHGVQPIVLDELGEQMAQL